MTTPIIIFSDAPSGNSGLARITRDLALRIHSEMKGEFDVCSLGYGAPGSIHLPFQQYNWKQNEFFIPQELPTVWKDFCGNDSGIFMTIGDIQRFLQVADTNLCADRSFAAWMKPMRESGKLKLWGYFPIDAHGIGGKLGPQLAHTLTHYDRRLVPSKWAQGIVRNTLPEIQCDAIPHGIDTEVFKPRENAADKFATIVQGRVKWPTGLIPPLDPNALKIGIIATNQGRKDWGLGIETVAELKKTRKVFLWAHVDRVKTESWAMLELLSDFGLLSDTVLTSGNFSDEEMSYLYSAMDVTMGPGRGEGFGYPVMESWSCGVPCITGTYGAQAEFIPDDCCVSPTMLRVEGPLNLTRPIYKAQDFAATIQSVEGNSMVINSELNWKYLWPRFAEWISGGVQ